MISAAGRPLPPQSYKAHLYCGSESYFESIEGDALFTHISGEGS
jgi:hypothetical protein